MNRTWLLVIGLVVVVLIAGVAQFLFPRRATAPEPTDFQPSLLEDTNATTTSGSANTDTSTNTSRPISELVSMVKGDTIISWNFKGAYTDRSDLIAKANTEIDRLTDLIGKGTYTDTNLYVSIANQYGLMGNGEQEYKYLVRAIETGGTTTGLPWHNLGVLMERLGALQTAQVAYKQATLVQPELKQWHYAYLAFLTTRMKSDTTVIEKALAAAERNIGQDADILQLYSEWKKL